MLPVDLISRSLNSKTTDPMQVLHQEHQADEDPATQRVFFFPGEVLALTQRRNQTRFGVCFPR